MSACPLDAPARAFDTGLVSDARDATHAVENQPPPFEDVNLFDADRALGEGLEREGGGWAAERVRAYAA